MSLLTLRDGAKTFYKDRDAGELLFLHHGWSLTSENGAPQLFIAHQNLINADALAFLAARVFAQKTKPKR